MIRTHVLAYCHFFYPPKTQWMFPELFSLSPESLEVVFCAVTVVITRFYGTLRDGNAQEYTFEGQP